MNIRGAAAKLATVFLATGTDVLTGKPWLKACWENGGEKRGTSLKQLVLKQKFAVVFSVVGMNLSCLLAWLWCEGS